MRHASPAGQPVFASRLQLTVQRVPFASRHLPPGDVQSESDAHFFSQSLTELSMPGKQVNAAAQATFEQACPSVAPLLLLELLELLLLELLLLELLELLLLELLELLLELPVLELLVLELEAPPPELLLVEPLLLEVLVELPPAPGIPPTPEDVPLELLVVLVPLVSSPPVPALLSPTVPCAQEAMTHPRIPIPITTSARDRIANTSSRVASPEGRGPIDGDPARPAPADPNACDTVAHPGGHRPPAQLTCRKGRPDHHGSQRDAGRRGRRVPVDALLRALQGLG
jgi:hypothetical protein